METLTACHWPGHRRSILPLLFLHARNLYPLWVFPHHPLPRNLLVHHVSVVPADLHLFDHHHLWRPETTRMDPKIRRDIHTVGITASTLGNTHRKPSLWPSYPQRCLPHHGSTLPLYATWCPSSDEIRGNNKPTITTESNINSCLNNNSTTSRPPTKKSDTKKQT